MLCWCPSVGPPQVQDYGGRAHCVRAAHRLLYVRVVSAGLPAYSLTDRAMCEW